MRLCAIALLALPAVSTATTCDTDWARSYRSEIRQAYREQRAAVREARQTRTPPGHGSRSSRNAA